jgi:hypothetical protein
VDKPENWQDADTCWNWLGAVDGKGYGRFNSGDGTVIAHRFSYLKDHELAEGMQLDHTCRNTNCVRPAHLKPVTLEENVRREFAAMADAKDATMENIDNKGFGSPMDSMDIAWELESRKFEQADVNYNPLGATADQGCANCQWFINPGYCLLVKDWPQPITPNGLSDQWMERVLPEDMMKAKAGYQRRHRQRPYGVKPKMESKSLLHRVAAKLLDGSSGKLRGDAGQEVEPAPQPLENDWFFTKARDGNLWWMAVATNNFRDNDYPPEVFTAKAHQNLMARYESGATPLPELWYWHTPGTRWGEAKMAGFDDGLVWYAGTVDPGMEHVAQKVAALAPFLRVSHGYRNFSYDDKARGIIGEYETFEVSPLPLSREANPLTAFAVSDKEMDSMEITREKRDHLVGVFGDDWVKNFEARGTALVNQGKAEGREQKDQSAPPVPDPVPVPAAINTPAPAPTATVPTPEPDQKAQADALAVALLASPGFKELNDRLGMVAAELPALKERLVRVESQLKQGDEARLDALVAARIAVPPPGTAPSEKSSNVVTGDQATKDYGAPNLGFDPQFLSSVGTSTR